MARGRKPVLNPVKKPRRGVASQATSPGEGGTGEGEIVPPDGMTPRALEKWRTLAPMVAAMSPLRDTDADALRQYCEACVLRDRAMIELEGSPLVLSTPNGAMQTNPLLKIIAQADGVILKLSERFGLDPASRKRLNLASKRAGSPFMDFLKKKGERAKPDSDVGI